MLNAVINYIKELNNISKTISIIIILTFIMLYCSAIILYSIAGILIEYYYCIDLINIITENAKGILIAGLLPALIFDPICKHYGD